MLVKLKLQEKWSIHHTDQQHIFYAQSITFWAKIREAYMIFFTMLYLPYWQYIDYFAIDFGSLNLPKWILMCKQEKQLRSKIN